MIVKFGKKIEVFGKSLCALIRKNGEGRYIIDFWTIGSHVNACDGHEYTAPNIDTAIGVAKEEINFWENF